MSKTTISIDTDFDEQLEKVEELIIKCEELGDKGKQLNFITIKELAEAVRLFTKYSTIYF